MDIKFRYFSIVLLGILCISFSTIHAQNENSTSKALQHSFQFATSYGFLLPHHPEMRAMSQSHFHIHELGMIKPYQGSWANRFNHPSIGFTAIFTDMKSNSLGKGAGIYPFVDFPLLKNRQTLQIRSGIGLGYLSRKFDHIENWQNVAIGSHWNIIIAISLNVNFQIGQNLRIQTGPGITHFSNGSTTFPNLGINLVNWRMGLIFAKKQQTTFEHQELSKSRKKSFWLFKSTWGTREIKPIGSRNFNSWGISSQYHFKTREKFYWIGGLDVWYNTSIKGRLLRNSLDQYSDYENLRIGLGSGIALDFDTWFFVIQMGAYLQDKSKLDGTIYHRFGIRYMLNEKMGLNLTLKSHYAKADHCEAGLIYLIKRK